MEKVQVQVEVAKEAHELGIALKDLALVVKNALKDGAQISDLGVIASAALAELPKAMEGVSHLGDEAKGDPIAFAQALLIPMSELVVELMKKDA